MEVFAGVGPSGRRRQTAEPSEERREGAAPAAAVRLRLKEGGRAREVAKSGWLAAVECGARYRCPIWEDETQTLARMRFSDIGMAAQVGTVVLGE